MVFALIHAPCSLQCPVSPRRTCEPSPWRRTRPWSHGQSLHGWHSTVCWKATALCFGPSSPTEVGAVGARPSGRCRVIITYLILNFSSNQPTHSPNHLPPSLSVLCIDVCLHLSHKALPVPVLPWCFVSLTINGEWEYGTACLCSFCLLPYLLYLHSTICFVLSK